MMIDEPGSFYICTETSPRCFVIQKVRAKDLPKVCDELGVLSLDDVDCGSSPRRSNDFDGKNVTTTQRGQGGLGGNTPPAPLLPYWWDEDCKQKLDACAPTPCAFSANGEEVEEYSAPVYDQQPMAQQVTTTDGYEVQLSAMQDSMCEYVADAGGNSLHDYVSPSSTGEQQLRVNVDQYPAYSSVMSSPSDDQPLSNAGGQQLEMTDDGQGGKWAPSSPGAALDLSYDELKTRVRHQLEYYFSRENLAADAYLRSQMDNDQFVKVTTLASFNMVKRLTADLNLILQALRESPVLQVNETGDKVRPIHKRCTLILREIPEGTKKEEVEELFASPQCPKIVSSEYALNNIWYVNFETDEDAQKAFLHLRQKVQCFKGKPILARIKTAPIPRVQQNGSRPTPPNTLPLQSMPYPAISPSPNIVVTGSSQMLLSPADSSTFANAPTPFSTTSGPGGFPTTPIENASATVDTVMTVAASSPIYYYPPGHSPSLGPTTAVIGVPPTTIVNPESWPPSSPNTFDLGYILAMSGFQAQGAYRPAVYVPAAPISPACHIGAVAGPRFPGDRSMRKPRAGSYPTHHQSIDRTGAQSADSGRPPPSYSRYGSASGARSANGNNAGGSGYYGDRKGSPYWKYDQNIHYNNIRSRPNRYALNGNYAGNGNGMNNYGPSNDIRPRYPPRGDRGGRYGGGGNEYWNASGYQPRPHRKPATTTTASAAPNTVPTTSVTMAGTVGQDKKPEDSFDLHSSSFPPLPTATSAISTDDLEKEIDNSMESHISKKDNASVTPLQQPTHILQREQNEQHSSASLVVKVHPRMKTTAAAETTISIATTSQMQARGGATVKGNDTGKEIGDQKTEHTVTATTAAQKVAHGVSSTRGNGVTIPVAVVQPNAQQKQPKVATADKSTATDLSPPTTRSTVTTEGEDTMTKGVLSDTKPDELLQEKTGGEQGKKLSYADMAKHAAAMRNSGISSTTLPAISSAIPTQKTVASGASVSPSAANTIANGKEAVARRPQTGKESVKPATLWDSDVDEDGDGEGMQYRRVKSKYSGTLRKNPRQYRNSDGQQDQVDGGVQVPPPSF